jgi:riboflavin synthase
MFSGLVEELGQVRSLETHGQGARLTLGAGLTMAESEIGASLAVNGVCLTVVGVSDRTLAFDLAPETLRVTALGTLGAGDPVNLERPLRLGDRVGGHLITGHIDGVGTIEAVAEVGDGHEITVALPSPALEAYLVPKGSVAVDGVSLTIAALVPGGLRVAIIPHTARVTTLGRKRPGARVNLEMDLIGKYVHRLMVAYGFPGASQSGQELFAVTKEGSR